MVSVLLNIAKYTNLETFLIVLTDLEDINFEKVELMLNDIGMCYLVRKLRYRGQIHRNWNSDSTMFIEHHLHFRSILSTLM